MVVYDWMDIIEERCTAEKAMLFCEGSVRLLPAPLEVPKCLTPEAFKKLIDIYKDSFDYILIDCPAGVGALPKIYSECSDSCIIIATPDEVSARSAYTAASELIAAGKRDGEIRLVINRFDSSAVKKGRLLNLDDMIDRTYLRLLGAVPEEDGLRYASVTEKPLSSFSGAKTAFQNIAGRIIGKEIEIYL